MEPRDSTTDLTVAAFKLVRPLYEKLVEEICFALTDRLAARPPKVVSVSCRAKEEKSFREKISRKNYADPIREITDLAGVRVVCNYESDLAEVADVVRTNFQLHEEADKSQDLDVEKMGYNGRHFIVSLGPRYSGIRYDQIVTLKCEVQVRTVPQDAWALISHNLVYKDEATIPQRLHRDLNNVASLLEIAQGVFDNIREKREAYRIEITTRIADEVDFLSQPVDFDTLLAYTIWKFPSLPTSEQWNERLGRDLDLRAYPTLAQINAAVELAKPAVAAYCAENPNWFKTGTDFITKSLGFVDPAFRAKHAFAQRTREAFGNYEYLLSTRKHPKQ